MHTFEQEVQKMIRRSALETLLFGLACAVVASALTAMVMA